jgi:hypothetical protein
VSGTYIHDDGTPCGHGITAEPVSWPVVTGPADLDADDARIDPPAPRPRCRGGQELMGYRLDPDEPAP